MVSLQQQGNSPLLTGRSRINTYLNLFLDLDLEKLFEVASTRWFRPNEVHAILSNYTLTKIQPQPIDNPSNGRVLLFDRKMLRNFRKDGHNWKKKKDGKTVQEAHEKLKIGNEDRIHVYYARSEDDPNFYRRCYWLLDKSLERIVLVHYRQTSEDNAVQGIPASLECTEVLSSKNRMHSGSPSTPVHSATDSAHSEELGSAVVSEETLGEYHVSCTGSTSTPLMDNCNDLQNHEFSLHDINTLEWDELVVSTVDDDSPVTRDGDGLSSYQQSNDIRNSINACFIPSNGVPGRLSSTLPLNATSGGDDYSVEQSISDFLHLGNGQDITAASLGAEKLNYDAEVYDWDALACSRKTPTFSDTGLVSQNNFGCWNVNSDSLVLLEDFQIQVPCTVDGEANSVTTMTGDPIFNITEISPGWSYSTEETKVIVVGNFCESMKHLMSSNIYCAFGDKCVAAEVVQPGVYRCKAPPQPPSPVNLFLTMDGCTPISQVLNFDYRSLPDVSSDCPAISSEDDSNNIKLDQVQKRLAYLLFSTSIKPTILSGRIHQKFFNGANKFALLTSPSVEKDWMKFLELGDTDTSSSAPTKDDFIHLLLKNKLQEWLLLKVAQGCKTTEHDSQGQGVIHLCAILNYTWTVRLFSLSGLSLDFRDIHGWTALHWAAYYGREQMIAALLSAGANPSLVTDPTSHSPGGSMASDLASKQGFNGLAAYLAEKALAAHFEAMSLSGNMNTEGVPAKTSIANFENAYSQNLSEQELCLKESLDAYRNAADAADRIQSAMRERALKLQTKAVRLHKPEMEASHIVAAMKIQHAYRNYNRRKMMKAATRIQSYFHTWKMRRDFVNKRKKAIKIQSIFRGHQVRKQYRKICWSVGVLEKAILRWRLKRRGLRGIQVENAEAMSFDTTPESTGEEGFFLLSRKQAEERVSRSVVRVQAMFRSYRAQQEYRRMKMAYEQAKLEFSELQ
ncbi:calmodulin-binding transcription activator CBT-like isoform X1 [Zingiber officinale]|uniref:calmodulin-binding transcription activator CBT-like isoform X1 n=1 Tax=Zingiber officinale TaxID=94328 RepID=UPI001C4C7D7E|nr:calmodulin-binding transcription activator CBT-like isoform X1 [Zingiber officinale]